MRTYNVTLPALYPKQHAVFFDPARIVMCEASTKSGKAQPMYATVYTPSGPVRMGDLSVGDAVCTPTGVSTVEGIYPQGEQDIYRVTFSDGSRVECTADHLWEVHDDRRDYRRGFHDRLANDPEMRRRRDFVGWPRVISLKELMAYSQKRLRRMFVPTTKPVQFAPTPVPVDPYSVGVLIAEGGLSGDTVLFSSGDREVVDRVESALATGAYRLRNAGPTTYHVTAGREASACVISGDSLAGKLRRLGLMGCKSDTKFIPAAYRYNSERVRWEVLRGIFDGDGFVDSRGQPVLEQTSSQLAYDVAEVAESLGATCLLSIKERSGYRDADGRYIACKPVYRLRIRHANAAEFFSLPRKKDKCRRRIKPVKRTFRTIERVGREPVQCIKIADDRGLYLTDRFVVTHNTAGALLWLSSLALEVVGSYLWVAPVYPQAKMQGFERLKRLLGRDIANNPNATDLVVGLVNGSKVYFKGGDNPDSIYGADYYGAVIDEASRCKEGVWAAVRSTLTATGGPVRVIGNVRGRKNWAYRMARRAEAGEPNMAYHRLTVHDAVEGGVIPPEEIEEARRQLPPEVFRELYLAEASDDGCNPFGLDAIERQLAPLSDAEPVVWGVDLAKSVDWTVAIALNQNGQVCRFERWQSPWEDTERRLIRLIGDTRAVVDETGVGGPVVERLQRRCGRVEGFKFTQQSKQQLMGELAAAIRNGEVWYPEGPIRVELESFEYDYTPHGVRYSAPAGEHDDCVCALALAVHCGLGELRRPRFVYAGLGESGAEWD